MSNKRITDLTELTNPTTDDVFPVVDIASNTTTKVQLGNLPVPTSVTTALATKENTITPGTTAQYFRGDKSFQTLDKTAVGLANVDNTSDANKPVSTAQQTALNAKQETLVSGTNIKTLNSTSLLGSGNIVLTANPSGVSGAIQFSNGSAFASDAANLFWDDTNNRLGIGTNAPTSPLNIKGATNTGTILVSLENSTRKIIDISDRGAITANAFNSSNQTFYLGFYGSFDAGGLILNGSSNANGVLIAGATGVDNYILNNLGLGTITPGARLGIKGSGSTSATTSLLVQNSAGAASLQVTDDGEITNGVSSSNDLKFTISPVASKVLRLTRQGVNVDFSAGSAGNAGITVSGTTIPLNLTASSANLNLSNGGVRVGSSYVTTNASAQLEVASTTRGFLPPRMTTTEKNAIATPAAGLVVYDSTTNKLCCYNGSTWNDLF